MSAQQSTAVLRHIRRLVTTQGHGQRSDRELLERFAGQRDETAFTAVLRRHGPMVLRVSYRVLNKWQDAEDVFQATFLLLAHKAGSTRWHDSVANWLYQVAYHLALKARAAAHRRSQYERRAPVVARSGDRGTTEDPLADLTGRELQFLLDEELSRLPEKYRSPLVLCYLEGTTRDEAAQRLGWPLGTLKLRLEQGRNLLRSRLVRRGLAFSTALSTAVLAEGATRAALPAELLNATTRAALLVAAGKAAGGVVSAQVASLLEGGVKALALPKIKMVMGLVVAASLLMTGAGLLTHQALAEKQTEASQAQESKRPADAGKGGKSLQAVGAAAGDRKQRTPAPMPAGNVQVAQLLEGKVLGKDNKPLANASVAAVAWFGLHGSVHLELLAAGETDAKGHFRLGVIWPSQVWSRPGGQADGQVLLIAAAKGYGLDWQAVSVPSSDLDIRLRPEQVITGRLIDLQGQPAAAVKLYPSRLGNKRVPRKGQFILQATVADPDEDDADVPNYRLETYAIKQDMTPSTKDRMALRTAQVQDIFPGLAFREPPADLPFWPKPVTTDAEGRFTLHGIPSGQGVGLQVRDERFAIQTLDIKPQKIDKPEEITIALAPARILEGTVTAADTGKPIPHAHVHLGVPGALARYYLAPDSPFGIGGPDWKGRRGLGNGGPEQVLLYVAFVANINESGDVDQLPDLDVEADENGHFRMGLYLADAFTLRITAPAGEPYLKKATTVSWPKGAARQTLNVALLRGVKVRGKITEAPSGKPVADARVDFWSKDLKLPEGVRRPGKAKTDKNGVFHALLPTGSWHVLINGPTQEYVYQKIAIEKLADPQKIGADPEVRVLADGKATLVGVEAGESKRIFYPDAWLALDLKAGVTSQEVEAKLRCAPLLKGRLVGPDGKPVAKAKMLVRHTEPVGASARAYWTADPNRVYVVGTEARVVDAREALWIETAAVYPPEEVRHGRFELAVHDLEASYQLYFLAPANALGGIAELTGKQADGESVTVVLKRCGSAKARFVDPQGKPLAHYRPLLWALMPGAGKKAEGVHLTFRDSDLLCRDAVWAGHVDRKNYGDGPATDDQGRVTFPALIPGVTYRIWHNGAVKDFKAETGKDLDLPDIVIKEPNKAAKLPIIKPSK